MNKIFETSILSIKPADVVIFTKTQQATNVQKNRTVQNRCSCHRKRRNFIAISFLSKNKTKTKKKT